MKLKFVYSQKGLRTKTTRGARTFEDGKDYEFSEAEGKSLLQAFPHNFIEVGKVEKPKPSVVEDAPDKMVSESKPKTKKKARSK